MSSAPNRLRELRKLAELSQEDLAQQVGTTNQQIGRLEKGQRRLSTYWMERIAIALQCRPADLLPELPSQRVDNEETPSHSPRTVVAPSDEQVANYANVSPGPETVYYLPLISWVRAGAWAEVADPYEPGEYERLVPVTRRYSGRAYALRIEGDSMQALDGDSFPDGSVICVEPNQEARNGSYVIAKLEDSQDATFKQLVIDGARRYLKPLNGRYPITEITREATICGVVRQLMMDFDR